MIKFINNINKFIKFISADQPMNMLGRWCHVNVPKCNNNVVMLKIDFANNDNNISFKKNTSKNPVKPYTPQEYIDGMHN